MAATTAQLNMNNNFEIGKSMYMHFEFADSLPDLDKIAATTTEPVQQQESLTAKSSRSLTKSSISNKKHSSTTKASQSQLASLTQQAMKSKLLVFASLSAMPLTMTTSITGTKIITADEEGYMVLPDSQRVMDQTGAPLQVSPGQNVLVGPDNKPVLDQNGEVCVLHCLVITRNCFTWCFFTS